MVWVVRGGDGVDEINWICEGREKGRKGSKSTRFFAALSVVCCRGFPRIGDRVRGYRLQVEEVGRRGGECYSMGWGFQFKCLGGPSQVVSVMATLEGKCGAILPMALSLFCSYSLAIVCSKHR